MGLELHEKPSPWSETWLDALSVGQISFGGADVKVANEVDEGREIGQTKCAHDGTWMPKCAAQSISMYHEISALDHCFFLQGRGNGSSTCER